MKSHGNYLELRPFHGSLPPGTPLHRIVTFLLMLCEVILSIQLVELNFNGNNNRKEGIFPFFGSNIVTYFFPWKLEIRSQE